MSDQAITIVGEENSSTEIPEEVQTQQAEQTPEKTVKPEETEPADVPEVTTEASAAPVIEEEQPTPPVDIKPEPEEAPAPKTEPPVTPAVPPAAKPVVPENPRVKQFQYQANEYIKLCANSCVSEQLLSRKISKFSDIIRAIINTTDTKVYDAAYTFFKEHRNDILAEEVALRNVHQLPTETFIRVQTVYTTMRELVETNMKKKQFMLDYGLIRDNMKLPAQHPFLSWIRRKLGK